MLLLATSASAQAVSPRGDTGPRIVEMRYEGEPGAWVPADYLQAMLFDVEKLESLERLTELQSAQLDIRGARVRELTTAAEHARQAVADLEQSIAAESTARQSAEDELNAWYRSPPFLLLTGGVVGAATVLIIGGLLP